jgi:hypothetical protein
MKNIFSGSNGNMPLSVTVRTFDGYTYSDLPPMLEGTSTIPVGGILHVSAHGLGWFGTTLDTST